LFWGSLKAIHAGNEDVLYPEILRFCYGLEPEFSFFCFGDPHAEDVFRSVTDYAEGEVYGFIDYRAIVPHLHPHGIQIDDAVDFIEEPILPKYDRLGECISNLGNKFWGTLRPH
jgi:hypothetical protein